MAKMKVAIYSRGLDTEQENPLVILLEELSRYDIAILLYNTLLEKFNIPEHLTSKINYFGGHESISVGSVF